MPSIGSIQTDICVESDVSSRLSSPQDHARRGSEHSSQTPSSLWPRPQSSETITVMTHKRKRSVSDEAMRYEEHRPYDYSPSKRPEPQHMANRALHVLGSADRHSTGYYQNGNGVDQNNGHSWPSERPLQPHHAVNGVRSNTSESQLAQVLQRETNAQDAQPRPWDLQASSNGEADHDQYDRETSSGIGMIGPKRKRNFSNRTKTGCMTCRRRKKKCDETHPVCKLTFTPPPRDQWN